MTRTRADGYLGIKRKIIASIRNAVAFGPVYVASADALKKALAVDYDADKTGRTIKKGSP